GRRLGDFLRHARRPRPCPCGLHLRGAGRRRQGTGQHGRALRGQTPGIMPPDATMEAAMRPYALPALALALLALAGCATDKRNQALNKTLMNYGAAIRWGDFTGAQSFIDK